MEQLFTVWSALDLRKRAIAIVSAAAMFGAVLLLARTASQPRMALLYAGLDAAAAGQVVSALEARGATVDVRGNAIYVDSAQRDALRLTLAGEGLPANGAQGYELLDSLSGFGTTAQMFDAAYWRAKEGELARTITGNRQFAAARVHISNPVSSPFVRGEVASAAVSVTAAAGPVTQVQATALRHLVASAVAGLKPVDVAIIDSAGGLVPQPDGPGAAAFGGADGRAETLRENVTRLLEARVGRGKAQVEVTVDPVTQREEITERKIDPQSRVQISTDSEQTSSKAANTRGGSVTVASNLPAGNAGSGSNNSQSNETRTRDVANYDVSETQSKVVREAGAVRRISVAVLVDGVVTPDASGQPVWAPRSADELKALQELVASAIGFDANRGDQITIRSLEFQPPPAPGVPVAPGVIDRFGLDMMSLIQLTVLTLVSMVLGLFVLRPILTGRSRTAALPPPSAAGALPGPAPSAPPGEFPEMATADLDELGAASGALPGPGGFPDLGNLTGGAGGSGGGNSAARLRGLIESRQNETVEVLSQWMGDRAEAAR